MFTGRPALLGAGARTLPAAVAQGQTRRRMGRRSECCLRSASFTSAPVSQARATARTSAFLREQCPAGPGRAPLRAQAGAEQGASPVTAAPFRYN